MAYQIQLPAGISDLMPSYAPDGSALAFTRGLDLVTRQIWIQKLDRRGDPNGRPTILTEESDSFMGITWMPERRSLLTSKGLPGSFQQMVRVALDGGVLHEVPVDTIAVWYPSYNAIRHRLAYQRRWMDLDILRFSLDKPNEAPTPVIHWMCRPISYARTPCPALFVISLQPVPGFFHAIE